MPERDQPLGGRESFRLTPFLLGAIVVALVASGLAIAAWAIEARPVPPPAAGDLPSQRYLIPAVGFAAVSWICVVIAFVRDQIMRHFESVAARLKEEAEQEGVFRGMNLVTEERRTPPPRGSAHKVVPFQR